MSDTVLRGTISGERIALAGSALQLHFHADQPIFVCQLRNEAGAILKTAPALRFGGEFAVTLDLGGVPAGAGYAIVASSSDGKLHAIGPTLAARLAMMAPGDSLRKVAGSRFGAGETQTFASLYADVDAREIYLRIAHTDDIGAFLAPKQTPALLASAPRGLRYSVIVPIYNVDKYLDACFESIVGQSLDFKSHIEIVAVDDGSTDRSAKISRRWQKNFPDNIRTVSKSNGGLSSARNRGLELASGTWVTFIDPDDSIDADYFLAVERALAKYAVPPAIVSCNYLIHDEYQDQRSDSHPLRYRFAAGERAVSTETLGRDIQITVNSAFLRRAIMADNGLMFDERVRPGFEDAEFIGRYLMRAPPGQVVFVPTARYFHRRRADRSSLQDTARGRPEQYDDEIRFGYLSLLRGARERYGHVPVHFQNMAIFGFCFAFRDALERPETLSFLNSEQVERYRSLLTETLSYIDANVLMDDALGVLDFSQRLGLLCRLKGGTLPYRLAQITDIDPAKDLARIVSWSPDGTPPVYRLDGTAIEAAYAKRRRRDFLGAPFVWEHIAWVPIGGERLTVSVDGVETRIQAGSQTHLDRLTVAALRQAFVRRPIAEALLPPTERAVRVTARSPAVAARYADASIFIDRDTEADDSAEHLYRYVREKRPDINAFFLLRRTSRDWNRFAGEGPRRLAYSEPEHVLALLNATYLISSHLDRYIWGYLDPDAFGDVMRHRFVWLQHGITQGDYSRLINFVPLDLMMTSTVGEFESIVGDGSPYRFTRKEVRLTGLPRHDVLLSGKVEDGRTIVIMPTWRLSLTGPAVQAGNRRAVNPAFYESAFARRWKSLLHSPRLRAAVERGGYRVVFVPHPNNEPYVDFFEVPAPYEVRAFSGGESLQDTFRQTSLFVTDYSSKAFDVGYMDKPLIYYQFDRAAVQGGDHLAAPGYFEYERDGFGPVFADEDAVLGAIERFTAGAEPDPVYRQRAAAAFPFRDGRCRERVLAAILALGAAAT